MISKIVSVKEEEFTLPKGVDEFGSYNWMPKPFREAHVDEFIHSTSHYTPHFMEYRQVKDLPELGFTAVRIYWYAYQGWGVRFPNKWHSRRPDEGEGYSIVWEEPFYYYKIGCDHHMKTVEHRGKHEERLECPKCGTTYWIDTS